MKVKLKKKEFERLYEVVKLLNGAQQQLELLRNQIMYFTGRKDQVLIELGKKYGFDYRVQVKLDENTRMLVVGEDE